MAAQEKQNLDMVMTWWREVLYAGHLELGPKYQAENYLQHNPNADTGRDGFIAFFTKLGIKPMNPIPATMPADRMPVVSGAKGDFVWLAFEHEDKDPRNPANTYHYNSFDVLRIENGKDQEDGALLHMRVCRARPNIAKLRMHSNRCQTENLWCKRAPMIAGLCAMCWHGNPRACTDVFACVEQPRTHRASQIK